MKVDLLYEADCPNGRSAAAVLEALRDEFDLTLELHESATLEGARALAYRGSPTILVEGRDPFAGEREPVAAACRLYATPAGPAGAPTLDQLRAVVLAAGRP